VPDIHFDPGFFRFFRAAQELLGYQRIYEFLTTIGADLCRHIFEDYGHVGAHQCDGRSPFSGFSVLADHALYGDFFLLESA